MGFTNSAAPGRFFRADAERQRDRTYLDLVAGLQSGPTGNAVSIDGGASLAAEVLDEPALAFAQNPAMAPRHFGMAQDQIDLRRSAHDDIFTGKYLRAWWETGKNGDLCFQSFLLANRTLTRNSSGVVS